MTIETLKKRISGKYAAIDKLNKKITRINEAKASNWEKNPYYYTESDLVVALKNLQEETRTLKRYEDMLQVEEEKANSWKVEVIETFLENWKLKSIEYFMHEKLLYEAAKADYHVKDHELTSRYNRRIRDGLTPEESRELMNKASDLREKFTRKWSHVTQFFHGSKSWQETLEKDLEEEKNRKYFFIIERTNKIVGQITDASNLTIGETGELNGFIIGEKGKAKVQTVVAGGNIQCFHFRTLIHEMK